MDIELVAIQIIIFGVIILVYMAQEFNGWEVHPINLDDEFIGWIWNIATFNYLTNLDI